MHLSDYAGLFLTTAANGLDVLNTLDIDVPARPDPAENPSEWEMPKT